MISEYFDGPWPNLGFSKLGSLVRQHQALSCTLLLLCTVVGLLAKLALQFRANRLRLFRTFDRGNVPSIGKPGLFAGNASETFGRPTSVFILDDLHKELGPTYGLFFLAQPWIMTSDLELLQRVFVTEGDVHINMPTVEIPFADEVNNSVVQARDDEWRRHRRAIAPSFNQHQMQRDNVFDDINQESERIVKLTERYRDARRKSSTFDVHYTFRKYTLDVIFRVAYGRISTEELIPGERDKFIELMDELLPYGNGTLARICFLAPRLCRLLNPLISFTKLGSGRAYIHSTVEQSLSIRRKLSAQGKSIGFRERKMIDSLVESKTQGKMDNATFKANLFFLLMAGHETSSFALTMLLFNLAWHPDKQDTLRRAVLAGGQEADYLDWCIQESLRLFPPIPLGIGRELKFDIEHKGMRLFKGTCVLASIWSVQHSAEYWGADVEQFRPERMGEPVNERERPYLKLRNFSFGHGPRDCLGKNLAMAEIRAVVAKLIARYEIRPGPGTPRDLRPFLTTPNMFNWIVGRQVEIEFTQLA